MRRDRDHRRSDVLIDKVVGSRAPLVLCRAEDGVPRVHVVDGQLKLIDRAGQGIQLRIQVKRDLKLLRN